MSGMWVCDGVREIPGEEKNQMNELLNNPAVQGGVAPFVVALAAAALLHRSRLLGLAISAGFLVLVALAIGFSFESLTATRKLVLLVGLASLFVLGLELAGVTARPAVRAAIAVVMGLGAVWVVLRLLQQQEEMSRAVLLGAAAALYLAFMVDSSNAIGDDSVRAASAALFLGLGSGVLALLGGSALLALVGIATGASAGAALLIQMITGRRAPSGWTLALPAATSAGLVVLLSTFTGELRWFCLLPLLAVPWATRLVPAGDRPVWITAFLTSFVAIIPALISVALAKLLVAPGGG
jgi:hypothetical protein